MNRRIGSVCLLLSFALVGALVIGGCTKPAPAQAPQAPAPKASPLDEIIAGAKKEGQVSVTTPSSYGQPASLERMRKAIREQYGVDLKITASHPDQGAALASSIMEMKAGTVPTYDLVTFNIEYLPEAMKSGAFERVDWRPLVSAGTVPTVILQHPALLGGISFYGTMYGLVYNPKKVSAAEVPRKLSDLADPKWKGRFGIHSYPAFWVPWAFVLGKDRTESTFRSILKNQALQGRYVDLNNRYLLGEIDVSMLPPMYLKPNREKGIPSEWQNLDLVHVGEVNLAVRTGAAHPNAAKLVAVYLTSLEGMKFSAEIGIDSHFNPGSYLYELAERGKKEGLPVVSLATYPGLIEFKMSQEYDKWEKDIQMIFQTGGK